VQDNVKIFNSYFATTTISKGDGMILRFIKKQGLEPNNVIIFPVNLNNNHWVFAKLDPQT
jgi:Ulp1 family protease